MADGLGPTASEAGRSPNDPERMIIKRIVAMPGDVVLTRPPYPFPEAEVPPAHVWVEGEDRTHSLDSNNYGPVSRFLATRPFQAISRSKSGTAPVLVVGADWKGNIKLVADLAEFDRGADHPCRLAVVACGEDKMGGLAWVEERDCGKERQVNFREGFISGGMNRLRRTVV